MVEKNQRPECRHGRHSARPEADEQNVDMEGRVAGRQEHLPVQEPDNHVEAEEPGPALEEWAVVPHGPQQGQQQRAVTGEGCQSDRRRNLGKIQLFVRFKLVGRTTETNLLCLCYMNECVCAISGPTSCPVTGTGNVWLPGCQKSKPNNMSLTTALLCPNKRPASLDGASGAGTKNVCVCVRSC